MYTMLNVMQLSTKRFCFHLRICLLLCHPLLLTFYRNMRTSFPLSCHQDYLLLEELSTKLISFLVLRCPTARHMEPIQRRQRRYNAKFRNYSTEIIFVSPLAPVLFLLFWYLRKMVLRACVLIVELSIILLFDIVILFHV